MLTLIHCLYKYSSIFSAKPFETPTMLGDFTAAIKRAMAVDTDSLVLLFDYMPGPSTSPAFSMKAVVKLH